MSITTAQVTVAQVAIKVISGLGPDESCTLKNRGAVEVFLGSDNTVTTSTGHSLGAGGSITFSIHRGDVWAISASGNNVCTTLQEAL